MSTTNWNELVAGAGSSASYEPMPPGDYELKVVEASHTTTNSNGKTMFKIKTQVTQGAHANRLVWDNLVISPESPVALGYFFRKMKAMGLGSEYFQTNPSNDDIARALQDRVFRGKLIISVYNGTSNNKIDTYLPATASIPNNVPVYAAQPAPVYQQPVAAPQQTYAAPQQAYAAPEQQAQPIFPPSQIGIPAAQPQTGIAPPPPPPF